MNRIKQLRKARGLRQADVARETCIDQKTLSNYEIGRTNPDAYAVVQLADFFGVTADYLLGLTEYNLKDTQALLAQIEQMEAQLAAIKKILLSESNG
ncbi:MAG: helix-turn-helix domain-containing protein [Clostridia bacterium]|nr:helix-turn-helix domain-containing protein [Clostridia bacterium]